jgi:DNA polymerase III delta prime subunit
MKNILNEKYRPKEFKDVIGIDAGLIKMVESGSIPHLLFKSGPGTSKTTTARIIIDKLDAEALEFNASKDRSIDSIRNIIEPFAKKKSDKLKIVFLDEFDGTLGPYQTALRNLMETYSGSTRFIATCNTPSKIIPAIRSRFTEYSFGGFHKDDIFNRLKKIITAENIKITNEALEILIEKYKDDIRSMINFLEKNKHKEITKDDISMENQALDILVKLAGGKWYELRQQLVNEIIDHDLLLEEIDKTIFVHPKLSIDKKRELNMIIAQGMFEMNFSFNKEIAFSSILAKLQDGLK